MVPTLDECYETLLEQRLLQCLEVIKAGAFRHIKEQARLDAVLQVLDRIRIVYAFSEYDFSSISFEVMPAANYQETSLMKNRMSRKTIVKPVIITITERWNELAQARSLRADTSSCLAYTGGRLGLTLPVLTDPEMDIVEQRHQAPFQDYTNVLDAIDYVKAPNQDQPVKLCWMTMTCPSLFQGEYRRQMELHADTTKITEFGRIYLEDISRCLGIPSEYPELFFVLLPDSFRCYGSVYQPPPEADGN